MTIIQATIACKGRLVRSREVTLRLFRQVLSLLSGSGGMFLLWHSFTKPQWALNAYSLLLAALALEPDQTREISRDKPMLGFKYACEEHQQIFVDVVRKEDCCGPERMEKVRKRLLAWLSQRYPLIVLEQSNAKACLGCAMISAHVDMSEIFRMARELARTMKSDSPWPI